MMWTLKMAESMREWWGQKRKGLVSQHETIRSSLFIPSVIESEDSKIPIDERRAKAQYCTNGRILLLHHITWQLVGVKISLYVKHRVVLSGD
jgi:hypothetical protein